MSERRQGDRIVVAGRSAGNHFPRTQAETQYYLEFDGLSHEGPFAVDGAIYGRDLRFRGPGVVAGPILGRGDIQLENHSGQLQRFLAGVHSSGNVVAHSRGAALPEMLGRSFVGAEYVIKGDVIAENVNLENAIVFGAVRGRRVKLTACLVLGQVLATEEAVIAASTLLAYEAPSVRFQGPICVLHALGTSDTAPVFEDMCDGAGQCWPAKIVFYPALWGFGEGFLMYRPTAQASAEGAALRVADWARVDAIKTRRRVQGDRVVDERSPTVRYVLSIGGRALNFKLIAEHVERLTWILKTVLEFGHYHPVVQQRVRQEWLQRCLGEERGLLDLSLSPVMGTEVSRPQLESTEWYVTKTPSIGSPLGPLPYARVLQAVTEGRIPRDALARPEGSDLWKPIRDIAEFAVRVPDEAAGRNRGEGAC